MATNILLAFIRKICLKVLCQAGRARKLFLLHKKYKPWKEIKFEEMVCVVVALFVNFQNFGKALSVLFTHAYPYLLVGIRPSPLESFLATREATESSRRVAGYKRFPCEAWPSRRDFNHVINSAIRFVVDVVVLRNGACCPLLWDGCGRQQKTVLRSHYRCLLSREKRKSIADNL